MEMTVFWLFGLVVLVSYTLEGITGFGASVISMPFLSVLVGVGVAKPVLAGYTTLLCLFVLARYHKSVGWACYRALLPPLAVGLPLGILLYNRLPSALLLGLLAAFTLVVAARGLLLGFGVLKPGRPLSAAAGRLLVFGGGVMHGAFASGGPLIILYVGQRVTEKTAFRATMCMVWLTLNTVLLLQMGLAGQIGAATLRQALAGLPFLAAGVLAGERLHHKLNAATFTRLNYAVLLCAGLFMAWNLR